MNYLQECVTFKVDNELIYVEVAVFSDMISIESAKEELACMYYLQLPFEKRSEGIYQILLLFLLKYLK